ncbi:hypothetical protein EU528_04665 [Candidatus Thorarchaeota archaeon]|nr:MAG: hypothetical protein EU528_04665 [Candidatus Thorarchaeota archaeon]
MSEQRYPRRGECGIPTFGCRWCGKQREYDAQWYLIRNYCSISCLSAHMFYGLIFVNVIFGYLFWIILDLFGPNLFDYRYENIRVLLGILGFALIVYGGCAIQGFRVRRGTPKRPKARYHPSMVE